MAARTQKTAASMIAMHRVDAPIARDTHVQDTSFICSAFHLQAHLLT